MNGLLGSNADQATAKFSRYTKVIRNISNLHKNCEAAKHILSDSLE